MRIHGRHYRTIWTEDNTVAVIDQTRLPHAFTTCTLTSLDEACHAIKGMVVRGAPLIGVTAAYGVWLAMQSSADDTMLDAALAQLAATRPTAVNLQWALARMEKKLKSLPPVQRVLQAKIEADRLVEMSLVVMPSAHMVFPSSAPCRLKKTKPAKINASIS